MSEPAFVCLFLCRKGRDLPSNPRAGDAVMTEDELYIIEANIAHYQRLLKTAALDDETRSMVQKLLAEAQEQLAMDLADRH